MAHYIRAIIIGYDFPFGGQELGSALVQLCAKCRQGSTRFSVEEDAFLKLKGPLLQLP